MTPKTREELMNGTREAVLAQLRNGVLTAQVWKAIENEVRSTIRTATAGEPDERIVIALVGLLRQKTDAIAKVASGVAVQGTALLIDAIGAASPGTFDLVLGLFGKTLKERS